MRICGKIIQRLATSVLCLITVLILTSCSLGGGPAPKAGKAPANQQIFTSPLIMLNGSTDLTTLDPALAYDQNSLTAISMIYTGLVQLDDKMQIQSGLASTWSQSSDGLTWTFTLRSGLKFSDGSPLTAQDVAYSFNRALLPATKSPTAPIYLGIIQDADKLLAGGIPSLIGDSLQVVNPTTLKITLKTKAPYFLSMLTKACALVVEQKLVQQYGSSFTNNLTQGGGDGPFVVKNYDHTKIVYAPNPTYYGPKPQLRQVVFPFYQQEADAYNAYAKGQVDTAGVPLQALPDIAKRSDFHKVPQLWINYYTMNYKVAPFDNIHIRQAFALAIDKTAIASSVWKNTVIPTNHIIPQGMPGYNASLTGPDGTTSLKGNPKQAQALLRQGLQESKLTALPPIKLTYAAGSNFAEEVQSLVSMWQKVLGVTVTADSVDSNTLLDQVSAATGNSQGLQMWGLSWVGEYPDPQDWLTRQFGNGSVFNNMNYGQNTSSDVALQISLQNQMAKADGNFQSVQRLQSYQQAEQQLVNDVAWLPIEQVASVFLRQPYVTGIVDNGTSIIPSNDWANIYILQH
ncbi:MAG TPA: peptide ABC transporter substrate-binding protein [Ktedonobacteraceae bacterium]